MTRKVTQNTRPSFSHDIVREGLGMRLILGSTSRSPLRLVHHTRLLASLLNLPMPGCTCILHGSWITRSLPGGRTTTLAPQSTQPSSTLNSCLLQFCCTPIIWLLRMEHKSLHLSQLHCVFVGPSFDLL